jgi:hypothetical protein
MQAKKAQIKMMETISVLIVFMILMTFVVIFYANISRAGAPKAQDELASLKAIEISQFIAYLPEFQCSEKNIIADNCFDLMKIEAFITYTNTDPEGINAINTDYYDLFEFSKIELFQIYPDDEYWLIYERNTTKKASKKMSHLPISVYHPLTNEYGFAILNVTVYS